MRHSRYFWIIALICLCLAVLGGYLQLRNKGGASPFMSVPGSVTLSVGETGHQSTDGFGVVPVLTLHRSDDLDRLAYVTVVTGYCKRITPTPNSCPNTTENAILFFNEPAFIGWGIYTLTALSGNKATIRVDTPRSATPDTPYGPDAMPALVSLAPAAGPIGTRVLITGSGFSSSTALHFAGHTFRPGREGLLLAVDGEHMMFIIPSEVFSCGADQATHATTISGCSGTYTDVHPGAYKIFLTQGAYTSTNLRTPSAVFGVTSSTSAVEKLDVQNGAQ